MKLIIAYIQPDKFEAVKKELNHVEVWRVSVNRARGCGQQKGLIGMKIGKSEDDVRLYDKIRLEIAVNDVFLEPAIEAILRGSRTYHLGDGKIFVLPLEECVRIRTAERGHRAIGGDMELPEHLRAHYAAGNAPPS